MTMVNRFFGFKYASKDVAMSLNFMSWICFGATIHRSLSRAVSPQDARKLSVMQQWAAEAERSSISATASVSVHPFALAGAPNANIQDLTLSETTQETNNYLLPATLW